MSRGPLSRLHGGLKGSCRRRVATDVRLDECVFMFLGKVIEHGKTDELFVTSQHEATADDIDGRYA